MKRYFFWVLLVAVVASAAFAKLPASGTAQSTEPIAEIDLTLVDIRFDPTEITIPAGVDVTFHLTNDGLAPHSFDLDSLDIHEDVPPGQTVDVIINAAPGEYEFYCAIPGHEQAGMVGTLTVEEAAEAPSIEAESPTTGDEDTAPFVVELQDIKFVPPDISVSANTPTTVTLKNTGAAPHNFSVEALGIDEDVAPGESKEIEITAAAGEYEIICNVPGHAQAGMFGTLTVQGTDEPAPTMTPVQDDDTSGPLEDRLAALETRVAALETAVAQGDTAPIAASPVAQTTGDGTREAPAAVGETVERDGIAITLLGAQLVEPGSFFESEPGMVSLALDLKIENNSSDSVPYGDSHVSIKDVEEGFEFEDTSPTFLAPLPLQSGDLVPGDFVRGTVIVEVSENSKDLLVRYTTDPYGDGEEFFWTVTLR